MRNSKAVFFGLLTGVGIFALASCSSTRRADIETHATATGGSHVVYSVLYSFTGYPNDGQSSSAGLIRDSAGNLYGTTMAGGTNGAGVVFKFVPNGPETVLHSFAGYPNDGASPAAGLVADKNGNLYGTTSSGGANNYGAVFELSPGGTVTLLHSFAKYPSDGSNPVAGLIRDGKGNLYGTTQAGGSNCPNGGCGTIFKVGPAGQESLLYSFAGGSDGAVPYAGLTEDRNHNFYGTTESGGGAGCGGAGCGTIFELTSAGSEKILHAFAGPPSDGATPRAGLVSDRAGNSYGTTQGGGTGSCTGGCGTVYKLAANGTETVLYSFAGGSDGSYSDSALVIDRRGTLFGTTYEGGGTGCGGVGCGTAFELSSGSAETVLHSFGGAPGDGATPLAGLVPYEGSFFGTTSIGGTGSCTKGCATIYTIKD